jgi:hypothetical protein
MTDVKRYVLSSGFPREHEDGKYVLYNDHTRVLAEKDASHAAEIAQREARIAALDASLAGVAKDRDMHCARIAELEEELKEFSAETAILQRQREKFATDYLALQRQVGEMRRYADHLPTCKKYSHHEFGPPILHEECACTCGLSAALSATTPQGRDGG